MRTVILTIAIMCFAGCAFAQLGPPPSDGPREYGRALPADAVQFKDGKVTMAMKDAPVLSALDQLFKVAGKQYSMDGTNGMGGYGNRLGMNVTLRIENATFEQALNALTHAAGLSYRIDNNTYLFTSRSRGGYSGGLGGTAASAVEPQPVSLRLNAMPVQEAYEAVVKASAFPDSLGWRFKDDLGKTIMPGARFSAIPVKMAAAIVVAAAGLVPPIGDQTMISRKGAVDFSAFLPPDKGFGTWASGSGWPCVAAYRAPGGVWRYFINNASMGVPDLLRSILPADVSFVIEDRRAAKDSGAAVASVRLMNVTLEEALDAILGPTGYTCKKQNGIYMIKPGNGSAAATTTQPIRKRTAASNKARTKP